MPPEGKKEAYWKVNVWLPIGIIVGKISSKTL